MNNFSAAKKMISGLLYLLPVLFLTAAYVLMTVTGEDVLQGAGSGGGSLYGIITAFNYNARLSDMYAYGVMPHFDYQFSFGPDTVFRLLDIAMAMGILYIMTRIILGRRPGLNTADGLTFGLVFLFVYLSRYCDSLYVAFSHIHNYLIIGLFSRLFLLPFALKLLGQRLPEGPAFQVVMLVCGFLFGFSGNVTPAAFLAALLCWGIFRCLTGWRPRPKSSWELTAVAGVLAACFVMYVLGSGVSHYTSADYQVDYISFSDALRSPVWVLRHILSNFRAMTPCLVPMVISLIFEIYLYRKNRSTSGGVSFSAACLMFVTLHTLAVTQVLVREILRLMIPAYFAAIVSVGFTVVRTLGSLKIPEKAILAGAAATALVMAAATVDMARLRVEYNRVIASVLEEIRLAEGDTVHISREALLAEESRLFGFTQYPFMADWTLSQPVYGKYIVLTD